MAFVAVARLAALRLVTAWPSSGCSTCARQGCLSAEQHLVRDAGDSALFQHLCAGRCDADSRCARWASHSALRCVDIGAVPSATCHPCLALPILTLTPLVSGSACVACRRSQEGRLSVQAAAESRDRSPGSGVVMRFLTPQLTAHAVVSHEQV